MADLLFTTYAELQVSLADYMYGRKDLAARIPGFITLAERRIFRRLRVLQNQLTDTGTTSDGLIALPAGYKETKLLEVDGEPLTRTTDIRLVRLQKSDPETGNVRRFAREGSNLVVHQAPGESMSYVHQYWRGYTLSDSETTNPILTEFPELYLYGALIEYMPFAAKDPRIATAKGLFDEAMAGAMQEYGEQETSGSPMEVQSAYADTSEVSRAY